MYAPSSAAGRNLLATPRRSLMAMSSSNRNGKRDAVGSSLCRFSMNCSSMRRYLGWGGVGWEGRGG
jgi:hypothetical protein